MPDLRDDPVIRCIERTGYPPWMQDEEEEEEEDEGPWAVYDPD